MLRRLVVILLVLLFPLQAAAQESDPIKQLLSSARLQIGKTVRYDGSYSAIAYPNGDVPIDKGVCTDVVIRAYRGLNVDLQKLVHEDIKKNFSTYPSKKLWGLTSADSNIDHRRVPNLMTFFERRGAALSTDLDKDPPLPGDLLTWSLPGNLPHIGIVSDRQNLSGDQYLVIHNIGAGTKEEEVIGRFILTGHYRFRPWSNRH